MSAFDAEILTLLQGTYHVASFMDHPYTEEQLKMKIVATNLKALVNTFLVAAEHPDEVDLNLQQVALGLLGTVDFLEEDLPEIDENGIINF